ncbi:MAG TPA: hypothetical protein VKQ72_02345 [Aggregatilineales bacterium]|nr:hypothetical protein [Aggregatilineales bacterium]
MVAVQSPKQPSITEEVLNFLVSTPTPDQIVAFRASDAAQERLRTLLDKNRDGALTQEERVELDEMSRVDHFFSLIKIKAMTISKSPI